MYERFFFMGLAEAVKSVFSNYATITGRAARSEYWFFVLFIFLGQFAIGFVSAIIPILAILSLIFALGTFIPSITVGVRRLHDINKSGWWLLLAFIPAIGVIILIIFFILAGSEGPNDFGDDPLGQGGETPE